MIRKFFLSLALTDNIVSNLAKSPFRTKWCLEGKCNKCGKCCQEIGLKIDPRLLSSKFITNIIVRWISWLFDFYLIGIDHKRLYLFFGCKHKMPDGTCGVYKWRPSVCRNYPIIDYFEEPALFPECGYKTRLRIRR